VAHVLPIVFDGDVSYLWREVVGGATQHAGDVFCFMVMYLTSGARLLEVPHSVRATRFVLFCFDVMYLTSGARLFEVPHSVRATCFVLFCVDVMYLTSGAR
jgi:hypothetical protein